MAMLLRLSLDPLWGARIPFILFYPAIMVSAWFGGLGPGLVTTLLSVLVANYLWMAPRGTLAIENAADAAGMAIFVGIGVVISFLNHLRIRLQSQQVVLLEREHAARIGAESAEQRLRLAVEAAPAAVVIVDRQGTIVLVNGLFETLFGYSRDEVTGQSIDRLVPERFRGGHAGHRAAFFADSQRRLMGAGRDLHALRKDGSEVPVEIGLAPFGTAEGTFVMAAITDITERKRTAAQLEAAMRARDDFVSVASHELRNPVNALQLQLALLHRTLTSDGARDGRHELAARASVQVNRLSHLINNLLDESRISGGSLVLDLEDLDLREVLNTVAEQFQDELKRLEVALSLRMSPEPVIGHWDRLRLEQVVTNLLSNALKFGNGKPIEISLEVRDESAWLSVRDHGVGIEPAKQEKLFARFERAAPGVRYEGFGLGLWISRQLVESMRGRISLSSHSGQGSTFSIVLPLYPQAAVPDVPEKTAS